MRQYALLGLVVFVLWMPEGEAALFSRNGKWGVVEAGAYKAVLFKNGQCEVTIKDTISLRMTFFERWKHYQHFPEVKFVHARVESDRKAGRVEVVFEYLWNGGTVKESLKFSCRKVEASYVYTPWEQKDTRWFTGLLQVIGKKKPGMNLVGMYSGRVDGGLEELGAWRNLKPRMKMVSLRKSGPYVLDIAAEGRAWLNVWKYPLLAVSNTNWKRTVVRRGETFTMKYLIHISAGTGTNLAEGSVRFVLDKRAAGRSPAGSRSGAVNHKKRGMIRKNTEPGGGLHNCGCPFMRSPGNPMRVPGCCWGRGAFQLPGPQEAVVAVIPIW